MSAAFTFPNRIQFGAGERHALPRELHRLRVTRPLIVTDPGIVATGLVDEVCRRLEAAAVYSTVQANPTEADVLGGLERYHADGCDGMVGFGGGSAIDAAKAIRLLVTHRHEEGKLSRGARGHETFRIALRCERDYSVRCIENRLRGAIILLQRDDVRRRNELPREVQDVAYGRGTK